MTASRRQVIIGLGGGVAAALLAPVSRLHANGIVEIAMAGRPDGSRVWFDPVGLHVRPGQMVHWINRDAGNAHTATAYDRGVGRPHRIPEAAEPWDSGYLLPGESFSIVLTEPGVYDYYCVPHELAGMVGRIIVGTPPADGWAESGDSPEELPAAALKSFPSVEDILAEGIVRHRETR